MLARNSKDTLPRTLVIERHLGIGDLIWHIPYFHAIAAQSENGKVSVMAPPTTCAKTLLSVDPCIEHIFHFELRKRGNTQGAQNSIRSQWAFAKMLRQHQFDRVFIFSNKARFGVICFLAGIPIRYGYGFDEDRWFINQKPYIRPYAGKGSNVYAEATDFAITHGLVSAPVVPKMFVPSNLVAEMADKFSHFQRPLYAFAIGSSEPFKQWGAPKFAALANLILNHGCSIILLGGKAEKTLAENIAHAVPEAQRSRLHIQVEGTVLDSAAILRNADFLVGNDTGILNMAAACDLPCLGLFGGTLPLTHDPILHAISGQGMDAISPEAVFQRLHALNAPGISNEGLGFPRKPAP